MSYPLGARARRSCRSVGQRPSPVTATRMTESVDVMNTVAAVRASTRPWFRCWPSAQPPASTPSRPARSGSRRRGPRRQGNGQRSHTAVRALVRELVERLAALALYPLLELRVDVNRHVERISASPERCSSARTHRSRVCRHACRKRYKQDANRLLGRWPRRPTAARCARTSRSEPTRSRLRRTARPR